MNNLPLLLVDKVSGGVVDLDDYWVCIDARPLNAKNRSKKFVLPKITDVIEKAKKATMMGEPGTEDWRVYVDNMLVLYEGDKVEEFAHQVSGGSHLCFSGVLGSNS